ncbi:MAG: SapC family protein [Alteromonadaceae bacterium]|nr:SapC family protein [Alteromonadaceae bacterium]
MANIVPIKKEQHQNLKIATKRNLAHAAGQHIVPVNAREFAQASTSFPVVFVQDPDSKRFRSVIMLGLEAGENLYYTDDKWQGLYVPQSIGMAPFGLGLDPEKEKTLTTCVDLDSPFVGEDKDQALFDAKGKDTEFFQNVQESLGQLYDNEVASEKFMQEIIDNDLLQELELTMAFVSGEKKKLTGIFTLNEKKLQALTDEQVIDFHKRGLFVPIYAMLGSIGQVNRLIQLHNDHSENKISGIQIQTVNAEENAVA